MTGLRLRIGILFTLLLVLHAGCDLLGTGDPRTGGPLLPLTVGNEWTYAGQEGTMRFAVTGQDTYAGVQCFAR